MKNANQQVRPVWYAIGQRLLTNSLIAIITVGIFCMILLHHGYPALIAPATEILYGMALLNASKYTLNDVCYLRVVQIITGLVSAIFIEYGLLLWAFGFGLLHIVYGITMYYNYEK